MLEKHRVFDRSSTGMDARQELMRLQQGSSLVSDYAIEFQTSATDSGWEGRAVIDAFLHGLAEPIKDKLLTRDLPEELDRIITLAIWIDTRLEDRKRLVKTSISTTLLPSATQHPPTSPNHRDETPPLPLVLEVNQRL